MNQNQFSNEDPQEAVRSTMEQLLAAMCSQRDALTVGLVPSQRKPILVASCHRCDVGAVLGKHRSMLDSLKLLAAMMGRRRGLAVEFTLADNNSPEDGKKRVCASGEWNSEPTEKLANILCAELLGPCHISVEVVTPKASKITVAMRQPLPATEAATVEQLETALQTAFVCIGCLEGRKLYLELLEPDGSWVQQDNA